MIPDSLFVISSALVSPEHLSIYSTEERFQQTLETLNSIEKYAPSNRKVLFDASSTEVNYNYVETILKRNSSVLYTGKDDNVRKFSQMGAKSLGESLSFLMTLGWIKQSGIVAKRIYKISGRYRLNDNFKLGLEHEGKYVFTVPTKTWMTEEQSTRAGVDHVYQSRLFHFDYNLLDNTMEVMHNVINDCMSLGIDIEHAYYKHFNKFAPVEMEKIGVCGNLAPNGESIDE